jgi:3-hydroxyacyl-CoA dehydrogenase
MDISRVGVVGAGTMGASIVVALVSSGYEVFLKEVDEPSQAEGLSRVERLLQGLVKRGLPMVESDKRRKLLHTVSNYRDFSELDLVIEAVGESMDVKTVVFRDLEAYCRPETILASTTSSLSITEIAAGLRRQDRVVGLHFFNPAHTMKLVEVVAGLDTSEETISCALAFGQSLDKLAIRVEECASFLVNRLLGRYLNEALWCLHETSADLEEIENAACERAMPVGPLALRDISGADIGLAAANFNYQEYGERFKPAPLLDEMVRHNWLGQKSGRGFYNYDHQTRKKLGVNEELCHIIRTTASPFVSKFQAERLFLPMVNEAFFALQERVCAASDLDPALMAGLGMKKGPLAMAEEMGLAHCLRELDTLAKAYGERFRASPLLRRMVLAGRIRLEWGPERATSKEVLLKECSS